MTIAEILILSSFLFFFHLNINPNLTLWENKSYELENIEIFLDQPLYVSDSNLCFLLSQSSRYIRQLISECLKAPQINMSKLKSTTLRLH